MALFFICLRIHTVFAPVFMLFPVLRDTQWEYCSPFFFCQPSVAFTATEVLSYGVSPFQPLHANLSQRLFWAMTALHSIFLKVPTHFWHLSIWQRSLSSAGSPLKAEARSYSLENPSPAHTWEAGSRGCVSSGCWGSVSWHQSAAGTQLVEPVNTVASQLKIPYIYLLSMG